MLGQGSALELLQAWWPELAPAWTLVVPASALFLPQELQPVLPGCQPVQVSFPLSLLRALSGLQELPARSAFAHGDLFQYQASKLPEHP